MSSLDGSPIDGDAALRAEYAAALIARGVSREDAQALAARTQYLPQAARAAKPSPRADGLLLPDTPPKALSARDAKLLEAGVAIVPASAFGGRGGFRISFATDEALLDEAVRRIAGAVA